MHRRSFYNNQVREAQAARFASELAGVLYDLGITHKELARALGVTHHTVDSWTRVANPKVPGPDNLRQLCAFLDGRKDGAGQAVARAAGKNAQADSPGGLQAAVSRQPPPPMPSGEYAPAPEGQPAEPAGNMQPALTDFVGRSAEIAEVRGLLNETRLLTLTGAGGVGKTRLALRAASTYTAADFPDGVWLVELDALSDPNMLPTVIAQLLGMRQPPGDEPLEALAIYIGRKRLLMVLDNCEHLVEACAGVAERLLQECRNIRIVATSREPLDCEGEIVWLVPPLSVPAVPDEGHALRPSSMAAIPHSDDAVRLIESSEAGQLFMARARAKLPDFELTAQNAQHIAQICRRLDGIPLALELAAARVVGMSVEEIARRLDVSLHMLTQGRRTGAPRHRALQASLDWSHDLLSPSERMLFRRLGVFVGGWTLNAAEAVCSGDGLSTYGVLGNLMQLVNKSLVVAEQREGPATRYRFLDTIRQYALERLEESGEVAVLRQRHTLYFAMIAEQGAPRFVLKHREAWNDMILRDLDNMRAALSWTLSPKDGGGELAGPSEIGIRLATTLFMFWSSRGETAEGFEWLERALARSDPGDRTAARAELLFAAGALSEQSGQYVRMAGMGRRDGQFSQAREWLQESENILREIGDKRLLADTLMALGSIHFHEGDAEQGRALLAESLALAREAGNQFALVFTLFRWGDCELELGYVESAQERLRESVVICREMGDTGLSTLPMLSLARIAWLVGDYEAAQILGEEALAIRLEISGEWPIAVARAGLAEIVCTREEYERAASLAAASLATLRKAGDVSNAAWVLYTQGRIAGGLGDYQSAISLWRESLAASRDLRKSLDVSLNLSALAGAYYSVGGLEWAATLFGFVDGILEKRTLPWPPDDLRRYMQDRAATRAALGEEGFRPEWERGRAMQEDEAAAFALGLPLHPA